MKKTVLQSRKPLMQENIAFQKKTVYFCRNKITQNFSKVNNFVQNTQNSLQFYSIPFIVREILFFARSTERIFTLTFSPTFKTSLG